MWKTSNGRIDRIVVFADRRGEIVPLGALTFEGAGRRRISAFRYARSWLEAKGRGIDPTHLPPQRSAFRSPRDSEVPLPFLDAAPDGWGRAILAAAFPDQHFGDGECLAAAGDQRAGELRFGLTEKAPPERWVPPHRQPMSLPEESDTIEELQAAAEAMDEGKASPHHLEILFRKSGDLGGARPKASIWRHGVPWIAKFRAQGDAFDDPRVEAACLTMANACGIEVPAHEVTEVKGWSVLLVRRFDRGGLNERFGYSSAATMMGITKTGYATDATYASVATKARQQGVIPCEADLFRRMLFNCFIHNTDDHLRNHGFLRDGPKWRLSPVFDLTVQRSERLVLAPAAGVAPAPDPVGAFEAHPAFGLDRRAAVAIYEEVAEGLRFARDALDTHGVSQGDREVLGPRWTRVFSPPAASSLPLSGLVRPPSSPGGDPAERLAELGIDVDPATHGVSRVGRGITVRRRDTGQLDNAPGMPARVRAAWTTNPVLEFFKDGKPVPPPDEVGSDSTPGAS
jgi:serine/threonine-protein kinase HipA